MNALIFRKTGQPTEVLEVSQQEQPTPSRGEVLVRVLLSPVNPSDLHMIRGRYGYQPALPASPGAEGVGIVEKFGDGVTELSVGARVVFLRTWNLWRDYVIARPEDLVKVPESLDDETAAMSYTNPLAAWALTRSSHQLRKDDWLLQTAAASSVGKLVLQLARVYGFRTINVIRRREQEAVIRSLGGDELICTADEDIRARIADLTKGVGVERAIDCVAGELAADIARSLAPNGRLLIYGALSSHRQTDPIKFTIPIFSPQLIYSMATVQGWWIWRWASAQSTADLRAAMTEVLALIEQRRLTLPEAKVFGIEQYREALQLADGQAGDRKILLRF